MQVDVHLSMARWHCLIIQSIISSWGFSMTLNTVSHLLTLGGPWSWRSDSSSPSGSLGRWRHCHRVVHLWWSLDPKSLVGLIQKSESGPDWMVWCSGKCRLLPTGGVVAGWKVHWFLGRKSFENLRWMPEMVLFWQILMHFDKKINVCWIMFPFGSEICVFDYPSFGQQMQNFQNLYRTGPARYYEESIRMPTLYNGSHC